MGRIFKKVAWKVWDECEMRFGCTRTLFDKKVNLQLACRFWWQRNVIEYHLFYRFVLIELLTSSFSFFSTIIFTPNCYLKLSLFRLQHYHEFLRFFLCTKLHRFRDINILDLTNFQIQVHHKKFLNECVTYSFLWTL